MDPMSEAEKEHHLRTSAQAVCVLGVIEGLLLLALVKMPSSGLFVVLHLLLLVLFVMLLLPMGFCLIIVIFGPFATFRKDSSSPNTVSMSWGTPSVEGSPAYRDSDQSKDEPPEVS